jgi:fatty acid desaturase
LTAVARQPRQIDYIELKHRVSGAGLLERQVSYHTTKVLLTFAMYAGGIALIAVFRNPWLLALDALFLAFAFTQIAFLAHSAGHKQILPGGRWNDAFCLVFMNLFLGGSAGWWIEKHNLHHGNPNHVDLDPDISLPVLAFSREQAVTKHGIARLIVKYQAFLFVPLLTFEYYSLRAASFKYLVLGRSKRGVLESTAMALHYPLYFGFVIWQLGLVGALGFLALQQGLTGVYVGLSFAPNHKGMPLLDEGCDLDFVRRQVVTSRNLTKNRVSDYLFGSLATQIEHHLFPTMAQNNMRKADPIVKEFCLERSIPYHETGLFDAFREIFLHLHDAGVPLRRPDRYAEVPR